MICANELHTNEAPQYVGPHVEYQIVWHADYRLTKFRRNFSALLKEHMLKNAYHVDFLPILVEAFRLEPESPLQ